MSLEKLRNRIEISDETKWLARRVLDFAVEVLLLVFAAVAAGKGHFAESAAWVSASFLAEISRKVGR